MDKNFRIDEIVTRLNAASDAYYGGQEEEMTNYEWDALFDELTALEKETGYVRPDSPTQVTSHSGNEMDGEGEKEAHEYPALSLAKTKKVEELQDWAGEREIWLSWKLDGSTLVATYDNGRHEHYLYGRCHPRHSRKDQGSRSPRRARRGDDLLCGL